MEKLIELLNEYEDPRSWIVFKSYDNYDGTFYWVDCDGETEIAWSDSLIISKKFWFIQRLVENEKIDINEFMHKSRDWEIFNEKLSAKEDDYLSLLMLLSIQDEPIEFLISILK